MPVPPLGRLQPVDLRTAWADEARDFTPWLAENLDRLGEAIGIELEHEGREQAVGPFFCDLLCREAGSDRRVIIENQLGRSDHSHLGQILTYAAGFRALTVVWIAPSFTEPHRAAIDWLNSIAGEDARFFAVVVELWRIDEQGTSAPVFKPVAQPNGWAKIAAETARVVDGASLSGTRLMQQEYWSAFCTVLHEATDGMRANPSARPSSALPIRVGRSGIWLAAVMNTVKHWLRVELYLTGASAKERYSQLEAEKMAVEAELGFPLSWEALPGGIDCRIATYLVETDPANRADWSRQHRWFADRLHALNQALVPRAKVLD